MNLEPLLLSYALASCTVFCLLGLSLPIGLWLSFGKSRWRHFVEVTSSLPLMLPPTVLGFYLLLLWSPNYLLGQTLQSLGIPLVFSFSGLVVASCISSFPFMVGPIKQAFDEVPQSLLETAQLLGKSRWQIFWKVLFPLGRRGIFKGCILTFSHTLGEFGVVLMIGGSLEGRTKVASIAIYEEVQNLNYSLAHLYSALLVGTALLLLALLYWLDSASRKG